MSHIMPYNQGTMINIRAYKICRHPQTIHDYNHRHQKHQLLTMMYLSVSLSSQFNYSNTYFDLFVRFFRVRKKICHFHRSRLLKSKIYMPSNQHRQNQSHRRSDRTMCKIVVHKALATAIVQVNHRLW